MATTGSSADRIFGPDGRNRAAARAAPRSLGAALREAGLGEAAPERRRRRADVGHTDVGSVDVGRGVGTPPGHADSAELSSAIAASRSPRLAVFCDRQEPAEPVPHVILTSAPATEGVVSPPPWLRAARRGRWRTRLLNAFGWVLTLVMVGSIVGLAGHVLGLSPAFVQATLDAHR
ncbi:hypothetical protein [Hyphomicrobium sp.]|jgi:hypothetical protein|uniref:hypothetical protein n=1 Tax=Hyphomicrobium sp. TaxID=82 RepID=UPI002FDF5BCC